MIIDTEIDVAAPPMKVWRAITDFPGYSKWHPFRTLSGELAVGQTVKMLIGGVSERRRKDTGRISVLVPGEVIAFDTGYPVLRTRESFVLAASRRGTLLRHRTEMTGPLEFLARLAPPFVANLRLANELADKALDRYLTTNAPLTSGARKRPRTRI